MRLLSIKSRAKKAVRLLRSRFVRGALILGYHRIADAAQDPYDLCVSPRHFEEQLEVLRHHARPKGLQDLTQSIYAGELPQKAVVLTLDDGYADNLFCAKPLLEHFEMPATLFVATGYTGGQFWWDELEWLILSPTTLPRQLSLSISGSTFSWSWNGSGQGSRHVEDPDYRTELLLTLYRRLLPLSSVDQRKALDQLWVWSDAAPYETDFRRAMTDDELAEFASGDLIEIGAHTVTHPLLAEMPVEAQRWEIQQCKAQLQDQLNLAVTSFSYPNGSASRHTMAIVKESGYECACASFGDVIRRGSEPFNLPRFWIQDWDGEQFARWLHRWLSG